MCIINTNSFADWYLGRNVCNSETGIFPKSHVRLKKARSCNGGDNNGLGGGCSRSSASPAASSTSSGSSSSAASVGGGCGVVMEADSAMAEEILWTLRNWRPLWRELFATGKTQGWFTSSISRFSRYSKWKLYELCPQKGAQDVFWFAASNVLSTR